MSENYFKKASAKTIEKNIGKYLESLREYGYLVFAEANYSYEQSLEISNIFLNKLNIIRTENDLELLILDTNIQTASVDVEVSQTLLPSPIHQRHERRSFTTLLGEYLSSPILSVFNTKKLETETPYGFYFMLEDTEKLFEMLPNNLKQFIRKTKVNRIQKEFETLEERKQFVNHILNGFDPVWFQFEDVARSFYAYDSIEKNLLTDKECFKVNVREVHEKDILCQVSGKPATIEDAKSFEECVVFVKNYLDQMENTLTHEWKQGDLIVIDAHRMLFGVSAYTKKDEELEMFNIFEKHGSHVVRSIPMDQKLSIHKLNTLHNKAAVQGRDVLNQVLEEKKIKNKNRPQRVNP